MMMMSREKNVKFIGYRDFSNFNVPNAVRRISEINCDEADNLQDVDGIEQIVSTKIKIVYDEFTPIVCKRVTKKRASWRNEDFLT